MTISDVAASMTYMQRKALRRLSRGGSISNSMKDDPLIRECYSTDHYEFPEHWMNIVEWCDAESRMRSQTPKLTPLGEALLKELDKEN